MTKRALDLVCAAVALVVALPLLAVAALGIRLSSPGPVLYRARRMGRWGRPFTMYKLRTMRRHRDGPACRITDIDDPRVFPFGRLLRATKVDELPQLVNILRGDMSVVGPRPEDPGLVRECYAPAHWESLVVRPGLSSPGSLYHDARIREFLTGGDPERQYRERLLPLKLALDIIYVRRASVWYDLRIVGRTIVSILAGCLGYPLPDPPELSAARRLRSSWSERRHDPAPSHPVHQSLFQEVWIMSAMLNPGRAFGRPAWAALAASLAVWAVACRDSTTPSAPQTTLIPGVNAPPVANAGGPYASREGLVTFDGSGSQDVDGDSLTYAWDFGDGSSGVGVGPTHQYAANGEYQVSLVVTDARSAASPPSATVADVNDVPAAQVVAAAGDISTCGTDNDEATARLLDGIPGTVLALGDNTTTGTTDGYASCYDPTWGRHLNRTYAVLGNHEYDPGTADATWDYFGGRAGPRSQGYFSFDLGAWHVIVVNSNGAYVPYAAGSAQDQWLQADLAATDKQCTLAVWHHPLYFSSNYPGWTSAQSIKIIWQRLYAAGADLVVNAQQHEYERLAPMDPDGNADAAGIREFNVGTGGESTELMTAAVHPNSEARGADFGVLKLTLRAGGYDWEFVPIAGASFTDTGSGTCH